MVPENYSVSALGSFPVKILFYMGNKSVPKFIFRLSRFPVYRGSVLGRFYCTSYYLEKFWYFDGNIFFVLVRNAATWVTESVHFFYNIAIYCNF